MNIYTAKFERELSAVLLNEAITVDGIINSVNKQRKAKNLKPVRPNNRIDTAARIQVKQLISSGKFAHIIKGAKFPNLSDRMQATGYSYSKAGEVLYSGQDDSDMAVQAWLGSKPHREAILHPDVREIGVSTEHSRDGRTVVCAVLCVPSGYGEEDEDDEPRAPEISDALVRAAKKYGKLAAKRLLIKMAQSDSMKDIIKSPIIQKIASMLR